MSRDNSLAKQKGFTLIEMVVVAPIALLIITGFIALMVTMVGDVIASRTYNSMTYDIQDALDTIERDVALSTQFMTTSGTLLSPQGKDGATAAFTSTAGDLVLGGIATDKNPIDPSRRFIHYNTPYSCADSEQVYKNRLFFVTVAYFVRDNSLWRRTYVPNASGTLCQSPWQINTCAPGYQAATRCKSNDSEILKNISNFNVSYYLNPQDTTALAASSATSASTIRVSISGERSGAGRTVTASSAARSTKLSSKDISVSPPGSPTVSATTSGTSAIFSWPGVPTATSYIVQYNVNGGSWITASENSTGTSFSVDALRGETVSIKVLARNATGTSNDTASNNRSIAIPLWQSCPLQNGWVNYGAPYEQCGYTITSQGVVALEGLIRSGSMTHSTVLFTLPPGYRPTHRLIFQIAINPDTHARMDINTNGNVMILDTTGNAGYLSLSGITFVPNGTLYKWNTLTPINGWFNYGYEYSPLQSTTDASGRVHTQGLIDRGSAAGWSTFANMTSGTAPKKVHYFPARASSGYNFVGMRPVGEMMDRGIAQSWYSIQTLHYNAAHTGWQNFTYVAGNPADRQMGNGWTYYNDNGSIHEDPQFTRSADGMVTIKGMIRSGATGNGVMIAKLPPGYRPDAYHVFSLVSSSGFARVDISPDGYILARAVSSTWTSLDGLHFMAEQ